MTDLVSLMDLLRNASSAEYLLRQEANKEWTNGNRNGPMTAAHTQSISNVVDAARKLIATQGPG